MMRRLRHYVSTQWQRFFGLNISPVTPMLFVGGQFSARQWPAIHQLGVRAVLSLQAERADPFVEPFPMRSLRLLVPDFHPPTLNQLDEGVHFIAQAISDRLPVFVHCHAGVGRAPLMTAAYLMARHGIGSRAASDQAAPRTPHYPPQPTTVTAIARIRTASAPTSAVWSAYAARR
jgi:predicted protein tyrosine phosphatase